MDNATDADHAVETMIRQRIGERFGDPVIGEEECGSPADFAWDVLAGLLLLHEAGGWTSDFRADNGLVTGNPVIVCTPEISARVSAAVEAIQPPRLNGGCA
jgi:fructose-1,6-bisphosphatase/inositol monophosphatase family enzyme